MFKPVMPYVADAMAHLLFYKEHMLNVHAHHGKSHAHSDAVKTAKNEQSEKSTNNKKDCSGNEYIIVEMNKFTVLPVLINHFTSISVSPISTSIGCNLPPPKA